MKNSYPAVIVVMLTAVFCTDIIIAAQINIPRVESMPNMPAPYQMRDWKQVASLYYNPHSEKKTVNIDLGAEHKSIYDAVENKFLVTNAAGIQSFSIEPNSAVLAVLTPASGNIKYDGKKTLINGVVVDYIKGK
jgi:hypothetical protein